MSGDKGSSPASDQRVDSTPLRAGLALSSLTVSELWVRYVGLGGHQSEDHLRSALHGGSLSSRDHNFVAHALNEHFTENGGDHPVAYTDEIDSHADERS